MNMLLLKRMLAVMAFFGLLIFFSGLVLHMHATAFAGVLVFVFGFLASAQVHYTYINPSQ